MIHPSRTRGASVLVDAVNASFETTLEAVHEVTDLYRRFGEELRVKKSALLVNRLTHDRAKLYERQASDCGVTVILFNSLDVACTWLGIDVTVASTELKKLRASISLMEGGSQPP